MHLIRVNALVSEVIWTFKKLLDPFDLKSCAGAGKHMKAAVL